MFVLGAIYVLKIVQNAPMDGFLMNQVKLFIMVACTRIVLIRW